MSAKELVAWGISHGLIHLKEPSVNGLTALGKKRKYKSHPRLKGLDRKHYHLEYMKLKREGLI